MRFMISLLAAIVVGIFVGAIMVLLDRIGFYLIVLVPVIGGAIIGLGLSLPYPNLKAAAKKAAASPSGSLGIGLASADVVDRRPSRVQLIVAALIGVLLALAVYWGGNYTLALYDLYGPYQEEILQAVRESDPGISDADAQAEIAAFETDYFGAPGFLGFVKASMEDETTTFTAFVSYAAEDGITINRALRSSSGLLLQGALAYAFWAIEALAMWFIACTTAMGRTRALPVTEPAEPAASQPAN